MDVYPSIFLSYGNFWNFPFHSFGRDQLMELNGSCLSQLWEKALKGSKWLGGKQGSHR